jgi:hypothetical protein
MMTRVGIPSLRNEFSSATLYEKIIHKITSSGELI